MKTIKSIIGVCLIWFICVFIKEFFTLIFIEFNVNSMLAIILGFMILFLEILVILKIKKKKFKNYILFKNKLDLTTLEIIGYTMSCVFLSGIFMTITNIFLPVKNSLDQVNKVLMSGNTIWINFLAIVIVAPVVEELFFRGIIFKHLLGKVNYKFAILIQGILFSLAHGNIGQILGTLFLGCFLGYIYYKTDNIYNVIIIHALNNAYAFLLMNSKIINNKNIMGLIGFLMIGLFIYSIGKFKNRLECGFNES